MKAEKDALARRAQLLRITQHALHNWEISRFLLEDVMVIPLTRIDAEDELLSALHHQRRAQKLLRLIAQETNLPEDKVLTSLSANWSEWRMLLA